ncbi:PI31 proteasome regulator N-terminal-domain-containing protein [Abortiporus biennis]|nr:PI31 proteasome regulator N-terminal-domain-containing protein [Abortiporus biennis]
MSRNILDPAAILASIPKHLPSSNKSLQTPYDALASLFHTAMVILGFRLIGIDDSSGVNISGEESNLPEQWNAHGPAIYIFRYKHEQSSLQFVLKVTKLGSRTIVNAIALETEKTATLDISTSDFTSPSFFPHDTASSDQPLIHGFISSNRVTDLMSQFQLAIVQKLIPGLRKEGYTESGSADTASSSRAPQPPPQPFNPQPQPVQPPFAPEQPDVGPFNNPLEIGRRDLEPFPRNPFAPPSLFPDSNGDGMIVGPYHPIFGPGMRGQGPGGRGPWGGDGYLPPLGAPPGARFDPVGPGLGPQPGGPFPGRRNPRLPGGGNMFEPDNDEFPPPGSRDMFS